MSALLLLGLVAAAAAQELARWELEDSDGGFTAYGATSQWQWGEVGAGPEQAATGTRAWSTGLDRPYLNDTTDYLALPSVDLSAAARPVLSFYHWYEVDSDGDAGWVEIWDGESWTRAEPIYGYPEEAGFTGNSDGWRPEWIDLTGVADTSALRFVFSANERVALAGWYLDDLVVMDGDPVPPYVTVERAPEDTQDLDGPYAVQAQVRDDLATPTATLRWTANEAAGEAAMTALGDGIFAAEIPGQEPDTLVSWWIEASDGENATSGPDELQSFRVYLAAPSGLSGPDGRVVGTSATLSWTAPDSPHAVLRYAVYCDDAWVADATTTSVEAPLCSDAPTFSVSAVYEAGEGDRSDPLTLEAWIPVVGSVEPEQAWQGERVRVTLVGESLLLVDGEVDLALGQGVTVAEAEVVDANRVVFTLDIAEDATPGERAGTLLAGENAVALPSPFEILDGASRPALLAISPDALTQGRSYTLYLVASAPLTGEPSLDLGEGVIVESVRWDDAQIEASVVVSWDAPVGVRGVEVDDGSRVLEGVELRVRNAATTPQRSCNQGASGGAGALPVLLAALALSRRGRRAVDRSPDPR